jgi:hypothetical protein
MGKCHLYEIHIAETLPDHWSGWFEDLGIEKHPAGGTIFVGRLPDQAALYGVLTRIHTFNLTLLSVHRSDQVGI